MEWPNTEADQPSQRPCKKNGLSFCKPLNANNDRPLMQMDRANQWSDYADIPNGKPPKEQTVLITGSDE